MRRPYGPIDGALSGNNNYPDAHNAIGDIKRQQGDSLGALVSYRQALQGDVRRPDTHFRMGLVFLDRDRKSEAIASLQKAQSLYMASNNDQGVAQVQKVLDDLASNSDSE